MNKFLKILVVLFLLVNFRFSADITFGLENSTLLEIFDIQEISIAGFSAGSQEWSFQKEIYFNENNLRELSNTESVELESHLLRGLSGTSELFLEAEKEYSVNAFFLVSLAAWESSWGESNFAKTRNNLFGYMAYDSDTNSTKHFSSIRESILVVAKHLSEEYLTEGGKYFKGYGVEDVNYFYASDPQWYEGVSLIAKSIENKIRHVD